MNTHILQKLTRKNVQIMSLAGLCILTSFSVGIHSAGNVQPFELIEAGSPQPVGDVDENGVVDLEDVKEILEVVQGYKAVSPTHLQADPNGDGLITTDDALRLLTEIARR